MQVSRINKIVDFQYELSLSVRCDVSMRRETGRMRLLFGAKSRYMYAVKIEWLKWSEDRKSLEKIWRIGKNMTHRSEGLNARDEQPQRPLHPAKPLTRFLNISCYSIIRSISLSINIVFYRLSILKALFISYFNHRHWFYGGRYS